MSTQFVECRYPGCGKKPSRDSSFCRRHDLTGMGDADGSLHHRAPNRGLHLYIVFGPYTRRCKIGSSANVWARLDELQSHSADDLIVWCWARDCGKYESDLHAAFDDHRLHGEWFSPDVTAFFAKQVRTEVSSEQLAAFARKQGGSVRRPPCPGCGSRAALKWRTTATREIAQCNKCGRYRHSRGLR